MTKVKKFEYTVPYDHDDLSLDDQINDFIKDKKLIDVKYLVNEADGWTTYYALVIYDTGDDADA